MALSDILPPGYRAYKAVQAQNQQGELAELQKATAARGLLAQIQEEQRANAVREAIAAAGGDPDKAMSAALGRGDVKTAETLTPLVKLQREQREREETRRGLTAIVTPEPQAPRNPMVPGPGASVMAGNGEVVPQPAPEIAPGAARAKRIEHLNRMRLLYANNPTLQRMIEVEIGKIDAAANKAPQRRERIDGDTLIQEEYGPNGWVEIGRGPRFARQVGEGDGAFGGGLTGRSLSILTRLAPAYGQRQLTPDQEREFESALTQYQQPQSYQNPDTGLLETRRPELPQFVQDAVRTRRGANPRPQPAPAPGPTPQPSPASPQAERRTAWSLADLTTGPVPAAAEMISRTPLVGDLVQAPQFTQARNYVPQLQRDLVRVLQNNPRFPEGERKAIEKEISIEPRLFDNSTAYRDRLIGIDDALAVRERNAFATSQSSRVGKEERIQAMNVLNALRNFRENLGVPPRISTKEDYDSLQSGAVYIDTRDGKPKRKK